MARNMRKPVPRLSFYKVLVNSDFTRKLRLPRVFVQEFRGKLPENVRMKITSSKNYWNVKVERNSGDGDYYFTGMGWWKFAEDVGLQILEFLVFWFVGRSTFHVSVYGINGRERPNPTGGDCSWLPVGSIPDISWAFERDEFVCIYPASYKSFSFMETGSNDPRLRIPFVKEKHEAKRVDDNDDDSPVAELPDNPTNPQFKVVMKEHRQSRVCVHKEFAEAAGLIGKDKVSLVCPGGYRVDDVVLDDRSKKNKTGRRNLKLELAVGWSKFRKANGLVFGETYLFEFIPSENVIQVKPL